MEKNARQQNKMGTMPMTRLIVTMSLPAIFSMTILAMYNVVDSIFISQYDMDGFTAVSVAYPLQMLLISASVGTAVGVNSLVARKLGEQNYNQANSAATHGLVLCAFTYAFFLLFGLFGVRPFMNAFSGGNQRVVEAGVQYFTCVLCLSLFSIVQVMIEKTLQATGNMIYPMLFQLVGAVVNIIFDPLLIFGVGFFPEMGVLGAAVATVFGQFCGMVFALIVMFKKDHKVKIELKGFRFEKLTVKNIYAVGFPSIIMQSISAVMMLCLNGIFQAYNSIVSIDVFGIYFKLQSFVFMPCFGLNQGIMPIVGYNYGARNKKRMYYYCGRNHACRHCFDVDDPRRSAIDVRKRVELYRRRPENADGNRRIRFPYNQSLLCSSVGRDYSHHCFSGGWKGIPQHDDVVFPPAYSSGTRGVYYLTCFRRKVCMVRVSYS